ncbi:MAG: hypothetical protein JJE29_01255 [Peptostreptococcaceae bacterium]|nr:hypothetical protein [Peptostreptococcaceae bacterium]
MEQLKFLIGNLKAQTKKYEALKPAMVKDGKSAEDILEILKNSQDIIDDISQLAKERRRLEYHLAGSLGLEKFDRKVLENRVPENLLKAFDEAVADLTRELKAMVHCQRDNIQVIMKGKADVVEMLSETSKGKKNLKTYYVKDREACFIDKKSE